MQCDCHNLVDGVCCSLSHSGDAQHAWITVSLPNSPRAPSIDLASLTARHKDATKNTVRDCTQQQSSSRAAVEVTILEKAVASNNTRLCVVQYA